MLSTRSFYKLLVLVAAVPLITAAALPAIMQDSPNTIVVEDDSFELTGVLEGITNRQVVIDGVTVDITIAELNTRLTLGDVVTIRGSLEEGLFTAREVNLADRLDSTPNRTDDDDDNFEIVGVVQSVDDGFITVSGQQFALEDAEISRVAPDLTIGQVIKVEGTVVDGTFNIREVGSPDDDDDDDDIDDNRNFDSLVIPENCVVNAPAGWVSYTIRPGDSISSIAARSGSDVAQLIQVNCIANPRFIVAGTSLFVARQPTLLPQRSGGDERSRSITNNSGGNNESSRSASRQAPPPPPRRGGNESSRSGNESSRSGNESSGSNSRS